MLKFKNHLPRTDFDPHCHCIRAWFRNETRRDWFRPCFKGKNGIMKTSATIGAIFEILEKNLYNAILRIASPRERIKAGMVYETIWTWFIKYFENETAGITEVIQKGEYARKLMNPKSGKDISYHDALTLSPSLICQEG